MNWCRAHTTALLGFLFLLVIIYMVAIDYTAVSGQLAWVFVLWGIYTIKVKGRSLLWILPALIFLPVGVIMIMCLKTWKQKAAEA